QAERLRFIYAEAAAAEQELEGPMPTDNARQMSKMDRRNETEVDFGIAERRAFAGNEHIARDRERHSAAACCASNGGDGRLAEIVLNVRQLDIQLLQVAPHLRFRLSKKLA